MATIYYDELVKLLQGYKNWSSEGDVEPSEAIYIKFGESSHGKSSNAFVAIDQTNIALNMDKKNEVIGIELI